MNPNTITDTPATGEAGALDWSGPLVVGGTGTGKTNIANTVIAGLRAEYELLAAAHRETARRYEHLRAAAQAAVVEERTGRRNPITPIAEALAELAETPDDRACLHVLVPASAAAWPAGAEG